MVSVMAVVVGYLVGSIPFGLLLGRLKGVDIRQHGSGNIGATNVGRVLGRGWGFLAFFLDAAKGLLPVLIFGMFARQWMLLGEVAAIDRPVIFLLWMAVATACVMGHLFPIFLRFKGGKGVATSLGALLGVYPYFTLPGLVIFVIWVVVTLLTRYVSVGSVVATLAFPVMFAICAAFRQDRWGSTRELWPLYAFTIVIALLVVYRHRGNLQRLYHGQENRIGSSVSRA
ncbi:MAG: glycerol-3-phosphate 1-O-acyltransferase PlsY [Phycisphaerae bacterium]|nr:glycerol-3-phosphate 1-O-acyltransferase PlsY [Phycisphaerae bacterium]